MTSGIDGKARLKREADALPLAFGAVIRYHKRWLLVLLLAFTLPALVTNFVEWACRAGPWVMNAAAAFSLACWLLGIAVTFFLIWKTGRLQKLLVERRCLRCGYPLPEGVGQRCSECGRFAEIALAPEG